MNSVITEALAGILILLSLVKTTLLLVNPRAWIGFTKRLYINPKVTSMISLAAAGIVLYFLIRSGLDIVQILAVCLFISLLILPAVAPHAPRLYAWIETQDMDQLLKEQWLYISLWIALLAWGVYALLS